MAIHSLARETGRRVDLTPEQAEASAHRQGVLLVVAGPGTGKTRVITERTLDLMDEGWSARNILCVSYTKAAAREMAERIAIAQGIQVEDLKGTCRTFHSYGMQLLMAEQPFPIDRQRALCGEDMQYSLVSQCLRPGITVGAAKNFISLAKKGLLSPQAAEAGARGTPKREALAQVYASYQDLLRSLKRIDYDDMIYEAVRLLSEKTEIREREQARVRHLMVDELQDTNQAQQEMGRLLAETSESAMFVGDPNQSIYAFAGANLGVYANFWSMYPSYRLIVLEQNHRSHRRIVGVYKSCIRNAPEFVREGLAKIRSEREGDPETLEPKMFPSHEDEAAWIVSEALHRNSGGQTYRSMAVLFRTNALSRALEDLCIDHGIPYASAGAGFYERSEVRLALSILGLVQDVNFKEPHLCDCYGRRRRCGRCYNGVKSVWALRRFAGSRLRDVRGLGTKILDFAERTMPDRPFFALGSFSEMTPARRHAVERVGMTLRGLRNACAGRPPAEALRHIYQQTGLATWAAEGEDGEGDSWKQENLAELLLSAARFTTVQQMLDFAHRRFMYAARTRPEVDALTLSTIHKSKGREWETVFLCGATHGILPHKRAEDEDEEDRLLYVATSRPREELKVSGFETANWFLARALAGECGFDGA